MSKTVDFSKRTATREFVAVLLYSGRRKEKGPYDDVSGELFLPTEEHYVCADQLCV